MGLQMNLMIITKSHAVSPEIVILTKLILKPYCRTAAMPTAQESIKDIFKDCMVETVSNLYHFLRARKLE